MACADWCVMAALVRPTTGRPPAGTACTRWPSTCGRSSASSASSRGWSWPASQPVRQDGPSPPRPAGAARLRHLSIRGMCPAPRSRDAGDSRRSCPREGPHGAVRYTAMCEPTPIRQLVSDLQAAEDAGSDFSIISTTTSRGWRTRATRDTRGPCSGRRRPPWSGPCPETGSLRPRRGREPQRAHGRRRLARPAGPPRLAGRRCADHPRFVHRDLCELQRLPFRGGAGQALGPAGHAHADRHRSSRPGLRPIRPPPAGVSRAQRAEQARLGGKPGLPEGLREVPKPSVDEELDR